MQGDPEPVGMDQFKGTRDERVAARAREIAGGSMVEVLASIGAVVLTALGLAGIYPALFLSIAGIVVGGAMFLGGGMTIARLTKLFSEVGSRAYDWMGGGTSIAAMAGIAGIVMSILCLVGMNYLILMPITAIVFGGALLLSSGTNAWVNSYFSRHLWTERAGTAAARETGIASSGVEVLAGTASIILGIIALAGDSPLVLSLIGVLVVGGALLLGSSAVLARFMGFFAKK